MAEGENKGEEEQKVPEAVLDNAQQAVSDGHITHEEEFDFTSEAHAEDIPGFRRGTLRDSPSGETQNWTDLEVLPNVSMGAAAEPNIHGKPSKETIDNAAESISDGKLSTSEIQQHIDNGATVTYNDINTVYPSVGADVPMASVDVDFDGKMNITAPLDFSSGGDASGKAENMPDDVTKPLATALEDFNITNEERFAVARPAAESDIRVSIESSQIGDNFAETIHVGDVDITVPEKEQHNKETGEFEPIKLTTSAEDRGEISQDVINAIQDNKLSIDEINSLMSEHGAELRTTRQDDGTMRAQLNFNDELVVSAPMDLPQNQPDGEEVAPPTPER